MSCILGNKLYEWHSQGIPCIICTDRLAEIKKFVNLLLVYSWILQSSFICNFRKLYLNKSDVEINALCTKKSSKKLMPWSHLQHDTLSLYQLGPKPPLKLFQCLKVQNFQSTVETMVMDAIQPISRLLFLSDGNWNLAQQGMQIYLCFRPEVRGWEQQKR